MADAALGIAGLWVVAYLVGAAPVTWLLARAVAGVDLRRRGSGNVGGSNAARQLGKGWLPVVAASDFVRGAGPALAGQYAPGLGENGWLLAATPLFTMVGNCWSPLLRFTGGRSVGVWAGGILAMSPLLFGAALLAYLGGWLATRRSAEWLLAMMVLLPPVCAAWPERWLLAGTPEQLAGYVAAGAAIILVKRLLSNGEPLTAGAPRSTVLLNRLLRDRDIADRERWVSRTPDRTG